MQDLRHDDDEYIGSFFETTSSQNDSMNNSTHASSGLSNNQLTMSQCHQIVAILTEEGNIDGICYRDESDKHNKNNNNNNNNNETTNESNDDNEDEDDEDEDDEDDEDDVISYTPKPPHQRSKLETFARRLCSLIRLGNNPHYNQSLSQDMSPDTQVDATLEALTFPPIPKFEGSVDEIADDSVMFAVLSILAIVWDNPVLIIIINYRTLSTTFTWDKLMDYVYLMMPMIKNSYRINEGSVEDIEKKVRETHFSHFYMTKPSLSLFSLLVSDANYFKSLSSSLNKVLDDANDQKQMPQGNAHTQHQAFVTSLYASPIYSLLNEARWYHLQLLQDRGFPIIEFYNALTLSDQCKVKGLSIHPSRNVPYNSSLFDNLARFKTAYYLLGGDRYYNQPMHWEGNGIRGAAIDPISLALGRNSIKIANFLLFEAGYGDSEGVCGDKSVSNDHSNISCDNNNDHEMLMLNESDDLEAFLSLLETGLPDPPGMVKSEVNATVHSTSIKVSPPTNTLLSFSPLSHFHITKLPHNPHNNCKLYLYHPSNHESILHHVVNSRYSMKSARLLEWLLGFKDIHNLILYPKQLKNLSNQPLETAILNQQLDAAKVLYRYGARFGFYSVLDDDVLPNKSDHDVKVDSPCKDLISSQYLQQLYPSAVNTESTNQSNLHRSSTDIERYDTKSITVLDQDLYRFNTNHPSHYNDSYHGIPKISIYLLLNNSTLLNYFNKNDPNNHTNTAKMLEWLLSLDWDKSGLRWGESVNVGDGFDRKNTIVETTNTSSPTTSNTITSPPSPRNAFFTTIDQPEETNWMNIYVSPEAAGLYKWISEWEMVREKKLLLLKNVAKNQSSLTNTNNNLNDTHNFSAMNPLLFAAMYGQHAVVEALCKWNHNDIHQKNNNNNPQDNNDILDLFAKTPTRLSLLGDDNNIIKNLPDKLKVSDTHQGANAGYGGWTAIMIATTVGVKWYYDQQQDDNEIGLDNINDNLNHLIHNPHNDANVAAFLGAGLAHRLGLAGQRPVLHPTNLVNTRILQTHQNDHMTPPSKYDCDLDNPFADRWDYGTRTIEIIVEEFIRRLMQ